MNEDVIMEKLNSHSQTLDMLVKKLLSDLQVLNERISRIESDLKITKRNTELIPKIHSLLEDDGIEIAKMIKADLEN